MPLIVHTARFDYGGSDRLDITRKGAEEAERLGEPFPGEPFAPSRALLRPALRARTIRQDCLRMGDSKRAARIAAESWLTYREGYLAEMRQSYVQNRPAWTALFVRSEVTLCCYCPDPEHCHRSLLAGILGILGATVGGEWSVASRQLSLVEVPR